MTNDAPPTSMQTPHTSDADLRLVAEAVGFQKTTALCGRICTHGGHDSWVAPGDGGGRLFSSLGPLRSDDGVSTRWLLPWLKGWASENFADLQFRWNGVSWIAWLRSQPGMLDAGKFYAEANGRNGPLSFAAALFDLCHAIIKENPA